MVDVIVLPKWKRLKKEQANAFRQLAFDFDLSEDVRAEIDNALYKLTEDHGERWLFVKISPNQWLAVMKATQCVERPDLTFRIWNAAVIHARQDTGEVLATRSELAGDAGTHPDHVSRAMTALTKIGAIIRTRRGQRVVYLSILLWAGTAASARDRRRSKRRHCCDLYQLVRI